MVQTRSATQKIEAEQSATNDGAQTTFVLSVGNCIPPAKKPRREDAVAPRKLRRARKPGELCQLNLDVLFLIARYIHPIDLLNLARVCKSLRELLMDKSSAFVWKTAFRQAEGLPDCPADLTELEYANLVFYARCNGCCKYTTTILWNVRRRYCPSCRIRRLRRFSSCNEIIRNNSVLAVEFITVKKETSMRVDRDKASSFMDEYRQASDKKQFIADRQKQHRATLEHAKKCEAWQKLRDLECKRRENELRQERLRSIFHRLDQHGYSREIAYFGHATIQQFRVSDFKTSKPLTDKEWEKIRPEWVKIMSNFRLQRLEHSVYRPRQHALASEYRRFITHPSPDVPGLDLLPHMGDLARFRPFMNIIRMPEETSVDSESFAPAFAQLSGLVIKWKKKLDTELAELVKIPLRLSPRSASGSRALARSGTRAQSSATDSNKLHLACALFRTPYAGVFTHFEVFSASLQGCTYNYDTGDGSRRTGSISDRFGIHFLEEAPYIVHACGLDPNVATADDMDHRNARLRCLSCKGPSLIVKWRHAVLHARTYHHCGMVLAPLSKSPRWQLIGDEHIDTIEAVERSIEENSLPGSVRCLLCKHHVGGVIQDMRQFRYHLDYYHSLKMEGDGGIQRGVHYAPIGIFDSESGVVEMVEEGDCVTFRVLSR